MNIALITAGGAGIRMSSRNLPKQFLELHGKPIMIYTLEQFEFHPEIDAIVIPCLADWQDYLLRQLQRFQIKKVVSVIPGGQNRSDSILSGLEEIHRKYPEDSIVLVHDAVRPLINRDTISRNIEAVKKYGSAVTTSPAFETVGVCEKEDQISSILKRSQCMIARAPQSFRLGELYKAYCQASPNLLAECADPATLLLHEGLKLHAVEGPIYNIKITTSNDYYMFRALKDAEEDSQILGIDVPNYANELTKYEHL